MTKSFENENMISENTCQVFMNDVMEEKSLQGCEINPNLQIENKQNPRSQEKINERKHKKLHVQKIIWKSHGRNYLRWVFLCVNDNKDVNVKCPQTIKCIFHYSSPILFCNFKTQARKHLILNDITNGITSLKKHVNANHSIIEFFFEEEIKNPLRGKVEKQHAKKNQIHLAMQLLIFYYQLSFLNSLKEN